MVRGRLSFEGELALHASASNDWFRVVGQGKHFQKRDLARLCQLQARLVARVSRDKERGARLAQQFGD
jgi:hypothetical protein